MYGDEDWGLPYASSKDHPHAAVAVRLMLLLPSIPGPCSLPTYVIIEHDMTLHDMSLSVLLVN